MIETSFPHQKLSPSGYDCCLPVFFMFGLHMYVFGRICKTIQLQFIDIKSNLSSIKYRMWNLINRKLIWLEES